MNGLIARVDQPQFWLEAELLEKLHYRNKNQHVTTNYFKKFVEVRRQIQKLKQLDARRPLLTLLQRIARDTNAKAKKVPLADQLKNLVQKKEEAEVEAQVELFVLVLEKLVASHRLLQNILHLTVRACKEYLRLMGLGTFLPFGLLCFGCLSRLHFLGQHYLISVVDSYNMCYQQARKTIPYSHLKALPGRLVLPKFHGKSKVEEGSLDDATEDLGDYLGGGGGLKKEALQKLAQISQESDKKLPDEDEDEDDDEGQAYRPDQTPNPEGIERELPGEGMVLGDPEESLLTADPFLETRVEEPAAQVPKLAPSEESSDDEMDRSSPVKPTATAPSKNFWLSQAIASPSPKLQNLPKKVGPGHSKISKPSKPAKPAKGLGGGAKPKKTQGGNEIDSIFGDLQ